MIFVSYYSGLPYKICSDRLKKSLIKFNLPHYIQEVSNKGHKQLNVSGKPLFVRECLLRFQQPVCWIDADSEIMEYPSLLFENENNINLQIYNWLSDNDNHVTRKKTDIISKFTNFIGGNKKLTSQTKLLCSSGTFAFNYSKQSVEFLDRWIELMRYNPSIPDDQVLDKIFNEEGWINKSTHRWLPKSYNRMIRFNDWLTIKPVINNTETAQCEI